MFVLGIVGGVASGKSAVAQEFARLGAVILDGDQVGHEVLRDPEVIAAFREQWGDEVVGPDGQILRPAVARRVFGADEAATHQREFLNSVTHPRIHDRLHDRLNKLRAQHVEVAVIDAALLYETGWSQLCDGMVFVDVPRSLRVQRAAERGWSAEDFAAREASQWPVEEKRDRATWVIDNAGPLRQIAAQVSQVWKQIQVEMARP